jgi:hypothetical protein
LTFPFRKRTRIFVQAYYPYAPPPSHVYPGNVGAPSHVYPISGSNHGYAATPTSQAPAKVPGPIAPPQTPYAPQTASQSSDIIAQEQRILKVDMMQHAWAVIETDYLRNPIFVPPNRINGAEDGDTVFVTIKRRSDGKLYAKVENILVKGQKSASKSSQVPQPAQVPQLPQSAQSLPPTHTPNSNPYAPSVSGHYITSNNGKISSSSLSSSLAYWTPPSSKQPIYTPPMAQQGSHHLGPHAPSPQQQNSHFMPSSSSVPLHHSHHHVYHSQQKHVNPISPSPVRLIPKQTKFRSEHQITMLLVTKLFLHSLIRSLMEF